MRSTQKLCSLADVLFMSMLQVITFSFHRLLSNVQKSGLAVTALCTSTKLPYVGPS